ncbi:hypothetical protein D7B24_003310 [Verticillium nonalfalfae]|uniref:CCHC-type domain-containing protein n=1 Tax=Verticillium nonalfalfae TaxID=1051616 RepID=A0A3M9XWD7_9PEZI|nr:uncharacterized protein D7B24_003310 [Verticillium nonalfalfae]RNJ52567.1 hypothetical protein D7B24_003310 [Verticillium nonalfalfae]
MSKIDAASAPMAALALGPKTELPRAAGLSKDETGDPVPGRPTDETRAEEETAEWDKGIEWIDTAEGPSSLPMHQFVDTRLKELVARKVGVDSTPLTYATALAQYGESVYKTRKKLLELGLSSVGVRFLFDMKFPTEKPKISRGLRDSIYSRMVMEKRRLDASGWTEVGKNGKATEPAKPAAVQSKHICYNCREAGHIAKNCKAPKQQKPQQTMLKAWKAEHMQLGDVPVHGVAPFSVIVPGSFNRQGLVTMVGTSNVLVQPPGMP